MGMTAPSPAPTSLAMQAGPSPVHEQTVPHRALLQGTTSQDGDVIMINLVDEDSPHQQDTTSQDHDVIDLVNEDFPQVINLVDEDPCFQGTTSRNADVIDLVDEDFLHRQTLVLRIAL